MSKQPEALRLAEVLEALPIQMPLESKAAAELRRLHSLNEELVDSIGDMLEVLLEAMRTGGWIPSPLHASYSDAFMQLKDVSDKAKEAQQ